MKDKLTKRERSELMAKVRGRGNESTELALVKLFRQGKITGWRRNQKIFGKPDFVFPKIKLALFVDGCFWHGCPKHGTQPKGNRIFWKNKFARNRARDVLVTRTLRRAGWRVLRIWEHTLRRAAMKPQNEARLRRRIRRAHTGPMNFKSNLPGCVTPATRPPDQFRLPDSLFDQSRAAT